MELIKNALTGGTNPWSDLDITTARRLDDDCKPPCTPNLPFRFDGDLFKTGNFDEVWLFGQLGERDPPLDESEVEEVLRFMNSGGGVFATGDHTSLGAAMCGKLPRVGSMRKWFHEDASSLELKAPGRNDLSRLDTLREGLDLGFHMDDQSDVLPQEIRPKFFLNPGGQGSKPHPLLTDRSGFAITVLPDHMHEGECIVPSNLEKKFELDGKRFDEYPLVPNTDVRMSPEVVAISTSAGGFLLSARVVPPVEPRSFVSIIAYSGDLVGIGRVAVDSSFHHFLDINLNGTGANNPTRTGFFDSNGNPTKDYQAIKQYFKNIAGWLCSSAARAELYRALLLDLRFNTFLIEEVTPVAAPSLRDYLHAGAATRRVIIERFSEAEAIQCCLALIGELPFESKLVLEGLINPWMPASLRLDTLDLVVNPTLFVNLLLGSAMLKIATDLPTNLSQALTKLQENGMAVSDALNRIVSDGFEQVLPSLLAVLSRSGESLNRISATLSHSA